MNRPDATTIIPVLRDMKRLSRDPWEEDRHYPPVSPKGEKKSHSVGVVAWLVPGIVMAALGAIGLNRPALWSDELATWGMATSSWHNMFAVLRWVDLIIGPYYALTHAWTEVAGASDVAIRMPSVIAMTGAAALTGALGARLANRRIGLLAGLIFAVLPDSSRFAQEARTYAITTFAAVLATFLLVAAVQRPAFWRYAGYFLAIALLGVSHPIALLLLAAHGWVVFAQYRRQTVAWMTAAFLGALPAMPLLYYGERQKSQVAWIPKPTASTIWQYPQQLVGVTLIGVLLIVLALFSMPLRRPTAFYTAWATLPFLGLLAAALVTPIFLARYLLFTLPAWALLTAVAMGRVRVLWGVLVVATVVALAIPQQLAIRATDGHGAGGHQLAAVIEAQERPGDGVIYGMTDAGGNWVGRDTVAHYLPERSQPKDVLMVRPERTDGQLAAQECPNVVSCLGDTSRIWVIRLGYQGDPLAGLDGQKESAMRARYQVTGVWRPLGFTLALAVLKSPAG